MSGLLIGVDRAASKIANGIGLVYDSANVERWRCGIVEIINKETAAPELLEFAKWAIGQLCGDSGTGESHWEQFEEFRKGKSAIAKAEGNT